jgi:hypothetical protein
MLCELKAAVWQLRQLSGDLRPLYQHHDRLRGECESGRLSKGMSITRRHQNQVVFCIKVGSRLQEGIFERQLLAQSHAPIQAFIHVHQWPLLQAVHVPVSQPISSTSAWTDTYGGPHSHGLPAMRVGPLGPDTREAFVRHSGKLFGKDSSKWELQGKPTIEYSEHNLKRCGLSYSPSFFLCTVHVCVLTSNRHIGHTGAST